MNKISIKESHIDPEYAAGYEDGFEMGEYDGVELENDRIRLTIKALAPDELIDNEDWLDGFDTARKLCLNIIENGDN